MARFQVQIVETDFFGWYNRLEDTVEFQTEEAALAYQKQFNKTNDTVFPLIEGNTMVARKPREIQEEKTPDE